MNPRAAILWVVAALCATRAFAADRYSIHDLGALGGGNSRAYGINGAGWVVGEAETEGGVFHAFVWKPDAGMTDLGTLGGETSRAYDINERGIVVGESEAADGRVLPFRWSDGAGMTNLSLPNGFREGYAYANNNFDGIAGAAEGPSGAVAIVWSVDGPRSPRGLPGNGSSIAYDINDPGDVVGQVDTGTDGAFISRAFISGTAGVELNLGQATGEFSSAAFAVNVNGMAAGFVEKEGATHAMRCESRAACEPIDTLNSVYSVAHGINAAGHAVGLFVASHEDEDRAFIHRDGEMQDLNARVDSPEPWLLVEARAINDAGQIVGYGLLHGRERAFLLTPRPEGGPTVRALVRITQPWPGFVALAGEALTLEAQTDGPRIARLTYFANGVALGSAAQPPFRVEWRDPPPGIQDLFAIATDEHGNVTRSPRVRVNVGLSRGDSLVAIVLAPDDGTALAVGSNTVVIAEGESSESIVRGMEVLANGTPIASATGALVRIEWTPPGEGEYALVAVAIDDAGLRRTSTVTQVFVSEPLPSEESL